MVELDQGYKIVYWMIFFIMFLHTYFIIFFTESKIRLSSKFHSKRWKEQTTGVLFDGILYLTQVNQNEQCPSNFTPYPIYTWPGTSKGVFLNNVTYAHPCVMTNNTKESNIEHYKINSIYSPSFDNSEVYIEYQVDTPYSKKCYNNKNNLCHCDKMVVNYNRYHGIYEDNYIGEDKGREIKIIDKVDKVNFGDVDNKKLCMKKVTNYTLYIENENKTCDKGIHCGDFCILNETACPNNNEIINSLMLNEKINTNKYISSLDFQYNGILCSALNKNISFRHSFVDESKHILSNFNRNQGNMTKEFCHIYNLTDKTPQDILLLDHFNSIELYNKLGITNKISNTIDQTINDDSISYNSLINTSQIYLTASTYFDFNKTNIKNCSRTILQDIKYSIETARKISLINISNIFILEFCFILSLCYLLYKHFLLLTVKTQPQNKFYYAKHILLLTFFFFFVNLIIYYTNINHKISIKKSIYYLDNAVNHNCFESADYMKHLQKIRKRLEEFSLLSYQIYEKLLMENVFVSVLLLMIIKSKISFREFIHLDKNEK